MANPAYSQGVAQGPLPAVSALASAALVPVITGPSRQARVLGASRRGAWLAIDNNAVVVITVSGGARLPNGIELATESVPAGLEPGQQVSIGGGYLAIAGQSVSITRWWEPRVVLPSIDRAVLGDRVARIENLDGCRSTMRPELTSAFAAALAQRDVDNAHRRAAELIGRGTGLTPEGDDFLLGALAGFRALAAAVGDPSTRSFLATFCPDFLALASQRTTALSHSLLDHSLAGRFPAAVGGLLRGLAGRGALDRALARLAGIGHSSGRAMAHGVVVGATAINQETHIAK